MDENEQQGGQTNDEQQTGAEQTPAEIMRAMKADYEQQLAAKDAEMERMKNRHAAEIRDILTGKDEASNRVIELNDRVKAAAKQIQKNLGV